MYTSRKNVAPLTVSFVAPGQFLSGSNFQPKGNELKVQKIKKQYMTDEGKDSINGGVEEF
jgi:hypothetical protein